MTEQNKNEKESLADLLRRTISEGTPLFNKGMKQACFELYFDVAKYACEQEKIAQSFLGKKLEEATDNAMDLAAKKKYSDGAWVLRHCFDDLLEREQVVTESNDQDNSSLLGESKGFWQDEKVSNQTDLEMGQCFADIAHILQSVIVPKQHKRYGTLYDNSFPASEAVEHLTSLGIVANRQMACMKLTSLLKACVVIPVSHENDQLFRDGTHLYRFPTENELKMSFDKLLKSAPHQEGTEEAALEIALRALLESPNQTLSKSAAFRSLGSPEEQQTGLSLATLAADLEKYVEIKDRKWGTFAKVYETCFIGNEAVTVMLEKGFSESRSDATAKLNRLLENGLIHHVTKDHLFEDKMLFYRFTPFKDLQNALDILRGLPTEPTPNDRIRINALMCRAQQFAKLDIDEILNSFYGCDSSEGWDLVDLQNWRNNMKRWGFGRREDLLNQATVASPACAIMQQAVMKGQ